MEDTSWKSVLERLLLATKSANESVLSTHLGISSQSIYNAKTKEQIPPGWVFEVSKTFGVSSDWLFFGRGTMYPTDNIPEPTDLVWIPMVEAVLSAGGGSLETSDQSEKSYAFRQDFITRKGNPKDMVLMRVSGDSMEPEILDNDVVLIDQSKKTFTPGRIFAVGFEDSIYLKRLDNLPGKIILKSANPAYPPVELDVRGQQEESFRIIGRVLWCAREYR